MTMFIKNYTVSNGLSTSRMRDGVEQERTVFSESGFRADVMLQPNEAYRKPGAPTKIHLSIVADIDDLPDMNARETHEWLRDQLLAMLPERPGS